MKSSLLTIVMLTFTVMSIFAQKDPFKVGKIDASELTTTLCPIDSGADAYVIGDYGNTSFKYDENSGFKTVLERHMRIKILKKSALDWADYVIPVYYSNATEEKVETVKANTFNLENGKVVVSQLEKSGIFKEEVSDHWRNVKFTLPNVKEGSIIEIYYRINSEFCTIWDWNFQRTIPTLQSHYTVEIPEYFSYKNFQNGYERILSDVTSNPGSIHFTSKYRSDGYVASTSYEHESITFQNKVTNYHGTDIPAFHDEPYMRSRNNYISSVEFELQSIQMPNSLVKDYTSDWKHINTELLKSDHFGAMIGQGGSQDIADIFASINNPEEKAKAIYQYIQKGFKWNGYNRLAGSKTIRKIVDERSGNSADINLLLVNVLKKSGFSAYPVILSTRDNGMVIIDYPVLNKFNYVIACLNLNGTRIFLDATNKCNPFGFLPEKCLNGEGRIIDEKIQENIDLTTNLKYTEAMSLALKMDDNGDLTGTWGESGKGYRAFKIRNKLMNAKDSSEYFTDLQKDNPGLSIKKYNIENKDSLDKDLKINMDVVISGKTENAGDLLIINPMLFEKLESNPFKYEKRNFPVDFSYNYAMTYVFRFEVPKGYNVESVPKGASISLPDNMAKFTFNCEVKDGYIQVVRRYMMNQIIFLPDQYTTLKEFYTQMVNKEAESIVLKKI